MSGQRALAVVVVALALLGAAGATGAAGTAADSGVAIENASYTNESVVQTEENTTYLWQSEPHALRFDFEAANHTAAQLCVAVSNRDNGTSQTLACREWVAPEYGNVLPARTQETFTFENWSANRSGTQTVGIVARNASSVLARENLSVVIITKEGDYDSDNLVNQREISIGTGLNTSDSDLDSLLDGTEVNEYGTDPLSNDTDGDALSDAREISLGTNATKADSDSDMLNDSAEVARETDPRNPDTDGDGLEDGAEITTYDTDPTDPDTDGDGLEDGAEITTYDTDPTDPDTDGDLITDGTEVSLGSSPTNPLTTLLAFTALTAVLVVSAARIQQTRGPLPRPFRSDDEGNGAASPDDGGGGAESPAPLDSQLLTDEDRVLRLLEEEGGRLKQSAIIEETGWSKSKVSRLLSNMADDEQVRKINIGRENIITLPGHEPENAKSSFDN